MLDLETMKLDNRIRREGRQKMTENSGVFVRTQKETVEYAIAALEDNAPAVIDVLISEVERLQDEIMRLRYPC
jgi:hypothetical protein